MATVDIIELIKPETGEKFYPYAHLSGVKGAELLPRIGSPIQTTLSTAIYQFHDALGAQFYPQTHAEAVVGLAQAIADNQFFEEKVDPQDSTKKYVQLKEEYTGLLSPFWMSAGGIGNGGGGGGGYGVESISSNQDGTVDFHFTGGDKTTIDLNHEHPQYPKKVVCTQAEYDALATKDSDTLYLIPVTT